MNDTKINKIFNKDLLDQLIIKNNVLLIGEYPKINSKTKIKYKCKCGNDGSKTFSVIPEYGMQCRQCMNKIMIEKTKKTNLLRYGCEDPNQLLSIKDKIKSIFKDKYGVESVLKSDIIKNKIKLTNIKRYGFENPFQNNEIKEKITKTLLNKYGVKHPLQNKLIYNKFENTLLKNYNVKIPYHSNKIKKKGEQICLKKFGFKYSLQNKDIYNKVKKTNLIKYGVEYAMQNKEIMEKTQKNSKKYKEYKMPSGKIRKVQGYEPFALRELLKVYIEDEIKTDRKDVPRIEYEINNKKKYHFPDIFIPHENKLIEVKSTWTYKCDIPNILLKKKISEEQGYNYEIWCFDRNGNIIEV